MLHFLRTHQRFFFIFITIIIVVTFSFFGTFKTTSSVSMKGQDAFVAIDGSAIERKYLNIMTMFLMSEAPDQLTYSSIWGQNFLNDGVISKDFLQTGLAEVLVSEYPTVLQGDLKQRQDRERYYRHYTHPQAPFVSAEKAWTFFAPEINVSLEKVKATTDTNDLFKEKVALFFQQRQFPPQILKQVLNVQESQYDWLTQDKDLPYKDLALFGYHNFEEWFGMRFCELVSQFIINSSIIAQQRGYDVTLGEARIDLFKNAEISYQRFKEHLNSENSHQYFNEQLQRMGIDEDIAVAVWRQVLLFRRLFDTWGTSVLDSPLAYDKFGEYSNANVDVNLYRLPAPFRFADFRQLQKFQTYLSCVSSVSENSLSLPEKLYAPNTVAQKFPELVAREYSLQVAKVDKTILEVGIGVKEANNWKLNEDNWKKIIKKFPDLAMHRALTREDRYKILQSVDADTARQIDSFVRESMISENPEWLVNALANSPIHDFNVAINLNGGTLPLEGIADPQKFMRLLDDAINDKDGAKEKLACYTQNGKTYYKFAVLERAPERKLATFVEASVAIDKILDKRLEDHYRQIRDNNSKKYKDDKGNWKPLKTVSNDVAEDMFAKLIKTMINDMSKQGIAPASGESKGAFCATHRFYSYANDARKAIIGDSEKEKEFLQKKEIPLSASTDQWRLEKISAAYTRNEDAPKLPEELFGLKSGSWSNVFALDNGDVNFFYVVKSAPGEVAVADFLERGQELLSADAQRYLMVDLLKLIKEKGAISFTYVNTEEQGEES